MTATTYPSRAAERQHIESRQALADLEAHRAHAAQAEAALRHILKTTAGSSQAASQAASDLRDEIAAHHRAATRAAKRLQPLTA
ncbi:MAG: hypothetical protein F4Y01_05080 [Gammaproteobacteria bacterium]|nr:hypothetical protein [Gammaproteobacteria bacterium]